MMTRGFFSGFVAIMGVLLLIALFYAQSTRNEAVSLTDEWVVGQSSLARDWALARNAYSQFASDAIADEIRVSNNCSVPGSSNFASIIGTHWLSVRSYLLSTYGVDCVANMDVELQNDMGVASVLPEALDNTPAYAILTCTRTIGGFPATLQHPFVIWKDVEVTMSPGNVCHVTVYDKLGKDGYASPPSYVSIEVQDTFIYT